MKEPVDLRMTRNYIKSLLWVISDDGTHLIKPGDSVWAENIPISLDAFLDYIVSIMNPKMH